MNVTVIDPVEFKNKTGETPEQSIAKMQVLDWLIMASDPSFSSIYKLNEFVRNKNITAWFKEQEPGYYWTDQQMLDNEKEL
jgi:hypothetical protein